MKIKSKITKKNQVEQLKIQMKMKENGTEEAKEMRFINRESLQ